MPIIAVVGATSRTGRRLVSVLAKHGPVRAVGRDLGRLAAFGAIAEIRKADIEDADALRAALDDAEVVVSCVYPGFLPRILSQLPRGVGRIVAFGSTRKFTRFPDPLALDVRRAEDALGLSGLPGLMLHPTMIYGGGEDRTIARLFRLLRRQPFVPLPGGGRNLVQPVYIDDAVAAAASAVRAPLAGTPSIVLAGPEPIAYADMVRTCARAIGRRAIILNVPLRPVLAATSVAEAIGLPWPVRRDELLRLSEDRAFSAADMIERLGVRPRPFAAGLAALLAETAGQ
jgi:uncharacterized protein YbjT (DUF2867 family)